MSEQSIPMFQRPASALPRPEKLMFHVKHTPIEKFSPPTRRPLKEPEGIGVDQL